MSKADKYKFDYTPRSDVSPRIFDFIKMVVQRDPRAWWGLTIIDIIHGVRYPIAFLLMGMCIDLLVTLEPDQGIPERAWHYAAAIFAILFVGEMIHVVALYRTMDYYKIIRPQLRADFLAYAMGHSFNYFQDHFAGSLGRKVSEASEQIILLNRYVRFEFVLPMTGMLTSAVVLTQVGWQFGAFAAGFIVVVIAPVLMKVKKILNKSRDFANARSTTSGQIVDSLSNVSVVKSYAQEQVELEAHARVSEPEMKAWNKFVKVFLLLDNYRRLALVVVGSGMFAYCLLQWQNGILSVGEIAAVMGMVFNFTAMVWAMSFGIIHVSEACGALNDSLTTLALPHSIKDRDDAKKLELDQASIDFDKVTFSYEMQTIFQDLDLNISAGQRIGLIGHSGAGKSTMVNLIQRFFDIQEGRILIDGQDISECTQQSLRKNIALIPQDTSLFHRSIMDNIRYGRTQATDDEVIAAAKKACADEFIAKLPKGYETMVGERGVKLSGGQRQRIAIARAILKDAPILILDEATSALDTESEKLIQESLEVLMQGKTVIAVAHRLSTINHLDRLLVMENGVIVEDGDHESLVAQDGVYARMWAMQSGGFLPE